MLQLTRGSITEPTDLDIEVLDGANQPVDPFEITYALYDVTTGSEVLIGSAARDPVRTGVGQYYAHFQVPENVAYGLYRIRWSITENAGDPVNTVLEEFEIVEPSTLQLVTFTATELDMIRRLRIRLRDNNPDRNYHFRPPTSSGTVNQFNRVFAYIWEDEELLEYLDQSVLLINSYPPATGFPDVNAMVAGQRNWIPWVITGAMAMAAMALTFNWIADEFDYSIGGVSLSIERSSKYESLKQNAEQQFEKMMTDGKQRTVKYMRGLRQSRYGLGVRSSFGPVTGNGSLTPRKFLGI